MRTIKTIEENIHEEYRDAKKYIKLALQYKDLKEEALAKMYYDLADEEMGHAEKLHDMAVKIIKSIPEDKKPPEGMMELYNLIHERDIEAAKEVEILMNMY
jgi:ferritin